jgi:hypothetical protein
MLVVATIFFEFGQNYTEQDERYRL